MQPETNYCIESHSVETTEQLAASFAKLLKAPACVALCGPLGAGKTAFVRGLARGLGVADGVAVNSPTFALLHEYPAPVPVYHFDLYRLQKEQELEDLAFDDYLTQGVAVVEWAERFMGRMPAGAYLVELDYLETGASTAGRKIRFAGRLGGTPSAGKTAAWSSSWLATFDPWYRDQMRGSQR